MDDNDDIDQDLKQNIVTIVKYAYGRASNFRHQGKWPYEGKNGIKEWLVDGSHGGMYKVPNPEDVREWW